ncbi:triose-phosphate transporter family-domain-containing protein [Infundibulicybe gibba]|nr:triose-phosphate transporter family-domain-containing protein [Infundibulicybe gibba]
MNNTTNGRFPNEKQRPGLHNNMPNRWGSDARALPTHTVWIQGSDEKTMMGRGNSIFARSRRTILDLRKHLSRYWTVQRRRTRAPIMGGKAPLTSPGAGAGTLRFVLLCVLWYASSALSSNTGKIILTHFRYPITLTFVQFGFVALYCVLLMSPAMPMRLSEMRRPSRKVVETTFPMGMFQVGGHVFSSIAISRIPVSTVHTIKALSPLFTVAAYALLFGVSYSPRTYFSLLPLTFGVMLACSFDVSASNMIGLLCAFGSALVFVSSNIFFKKIMPSNGGGAGAAHKLDKLNLLLYSSSMAFLLMVPIWAYYDLPLLLSNTHPSHTSTHASTHGHSLPLYFFLNGTVHFLQNILAFVLLSSTSPVTYSIASLIKRVAVICIAIVWFAQSIHPLQGCGIVMTFVGFISTTMLRGMWSRGRKGCSVLSASAVACFLAPRVKHGCLAPRKHPQSQSRRSQRPQARTASRQCTVARAHRQAVGTRTTMGIYIHRYRS